MFIHNDLTICTKHKSGTRINDENENRKVVLCQDVKNCSSENSVFNFKILGSNILTYGTSNKYFNHVAGLKR